MTQRKIRVLHVLDSFDPGGAQEVVANLLAGCDREKYEMEVASMHRHGVYTERFEALGAKVFSLSPNKYLPFYVPRLVSLLAGGRYDIVHCHLTASNLIAKPLAGLCGVPVIINHDHANDAARQNRKLLCWLDRQANKLSSHICAVSRSTRDFLIRHEEIAEEKVSLVYNGVDLERFTSGKMTRAEARQKHGLPADGICLAGIGRLTAQKNFGVLLEAAAKIFTSRPDSFLVIAGDGPLDGELRHQAAKLGIEKRTFFTGYLKDTATLYPAVDILVMPSLFEGLPIVLLEAMAMKVSFVGSAVDGIEEIVVDSVDGTLVREGDASDYAAAIAVLMDNPQRASELTAAARKKVTERFSSEAMCRSIEQIYQKCLNTP